MDSTIIKEKKKTTIVYGSFLENRVVDVKPVESSGKWKTLLVKGQEMKKDPFIYNKVKRSFQVPLNNERNGGGVKVILDNTKRVFIEKYIADFPTGMTEQEFFEKELGEDMNPYNGHDTNFWKNSKKARVTLTKKGLTLNLNRIMDMLKYKILIINTMHIAPSFDDRKLKATYEFMIVTEGKIVSRKLEEAEIQSAAYIKYAEITRSKSTMIDFIKSLGRVIPIKHDDDWLKGEVLNVLQNNASTFLALVNDPSYASKIFIQDAVEAGAIKRMNKNRYVSDNGIELGDLNSTINYLADVENQEVKARVKSRVEMFKKK